MHAKKGHVEAAEILEAAMREPANAGEPIPAAYPAAYGEPIHHDEADMPAGDSTAHRPFI